MPVRPSSPTSLASASRTAVALTAVLVTAACGDSNEPSGGGAVNSQQAAVLGTALASSGVGGQLAAFAPLALTLTGRVGTFTANPALNALVASVVEEVGRPLAQTGSITGGYSAVAVIANIQVTAAGQTVRANTIGVVGWNGLTTTTVANVLQAGIVRAGTAPAAFTASGGDLAAAIGGSGGGYGAFSSTSPSTVTYIGNSGTFSATSWSTSGSTSCGAPIPGFGSFSCTYGTGTMSGAFNFSGPRLTGGTGSITVPSTSFTDLPTVIVNITATQG